MAVSTSVSHLLPLATPPSPATPDYALSYVPSTLPASAHSVLMTPCEADEHCFQMRLGGSERLRFSPPSHSTASTGWRRTCTGRLAPNHQAALSLGPLPCPAQSWKLAFGTWDRKHRLTSSVPHASPLSLLLCLQLMPLLKLQHNHISIYHELFIMWNDKVSRSRRLQAAGARPLSTEHRHATLTPLVARAVTPNVATPDSSTLMGAAPEPLWASPHGSPQQPQQRG